jgi:amidohydrolase
MTGVDGRVPAAARLRHLLAGVPAALTPMLELYVELHRRPELSGQEERTARQIGAALTRYGFAVTHRVGGHGVVGVLRNDEGPVVLLRAELDALPIREGTGVPYASTATVVGPDGHRRPVMHACGHDMHLAALCATAMVLSHARDRWRGTVIAVGQPAEETLTGAAAMLSDGLYRRWGRPDAALAQHVGPLPAGLVGHSTGLTTAGSRALKITVPGRGGHAGYPDIALNPIPVAAAIVTRLTELFPARRHTTDDVSLTVGALHAGDRENVITDRATLRLTLRSLAEAPLDRAVATVGDEVTRICSAAGCPTRPEISVMSGTPPGHNDPWTATRVRDAHVAALGATRVLSIPPSGATDDFALYRAGTEDDPVPTAYWATGSVSKSAWEQTPGATIAEKLAHLPVNHSPQFAPEPVRTLRTSTIALLAGAWSLLAAPDQHDTERDQT